MAKRLAPDEFKRNETVKTLDALPGVPKGTGGRVYLVDGFAWTRYRVLFDNGIDVGSLDGSTLARPRDYEAALERREQAAVQAEAAVGAEAADEGAAEGGGGGDKTVNGVVVPALLLDRSKRARRAVVGRLTRPRAGPGRGRGSPMKVSTSLSYAGGFKEAAPQVVDLEKAGLDIVWVAEAYGFDARQPDGLPGRRHRDASRSARASCRSTPAPRRCSAMTAAGVDALSDGRCILGLGASGPAGHRGLARRARTTQPLGPHPRDHRDLPQGVGPRAASTYDGKAYTLPLPPEQGTGLGKPLKIITHPVRRRIPIYVAVARPEERAS